MTRSVFDQRLELPYSCAFDVKCRSNYKIANCALQGVLFRAVSWLNTGLFYYTSLSVLHFFFKHNSKDKFGFFSFRATLGGNYFDIF